MKKYFWILLVLVADIVYSQCNTNFSVSVVAGTCASNASLVVKVPASSNCGGWFAQIVKTTGGFPVILNVPANGGDVVFNSLSAGSYNVSLSDGVTTVQYPSNPVSVTSSYVPMSFKTTSTAPTCRSDAPSYTPDGSLTVNISTGGIGPFKYDVVSSLGSQTFTTAGASSADRTHTFNGMNGGRLLP
ncbi:hypothetical protein [Flavobacterium humidisoli]|uniref:SprB repeat-containing protein n=1 Tax=Flavobacterium humidisoli TaxID=2937442 RepID=A0ABY4M1T5_9FLAO|nr:hypothetical protein [Flavobacterium humidisoli]UPZ17890.1 hypothetical protein M0M44_11190 [Flavobacterium humidisoli]